MEADSLFFLLTIAEIQVELSETETERKQIEDIRLFAKSLIKKVDNSKLCKVQNNKGIMNKNRIKQGKVVERLKKKYSEVEVVEK